MHTDLKAIGVYDKELDLFESQYVTPEGISYNSYIIFDEKTALIDTVDQRMADEWRDNLLSSLPEGKTIDYLIVQHLEPDHSSQIEWVMERFPECRLVCTAVAHKMLPLVADNAPFDHRIMEVAEGDTLSLGTHELHFITAPIVHWPEVMMVYDSTAKTLFSADGFGRFGAPDPSQPWACEARRYYFGIVGKYGVQAQNLLKKAAALDIQIICPLHGPILKEDLGYYLNLYQTWTSYSVETEGVAIAYASAYGNTKKAAELLAEKLQEKGCPKVALNDLARCDMAEAVEDAFRYGKLVLASPTYNGDVFPFMREFIHDLTERNYQKRTIGLIENGSWAPTAARVMQKMFEGSKEITFTETSVKIMSALNDESIAMIDALAEELCKD